MSGDIGVVEMSRKVGLNDTSRKVGQVEMSGIAAVFKLSFFGSFGSGGFELQLSASAWLTANVA
jgi:hypothetical protein